MTGVVRALDPPSRWLNSWDLHVKAHQNIPHASVLGKARKRCMQVPGRVLGGRAAQHARGAACVRAAWPGGQHGARHAGDAALARPARAAPAAGAAAAASDDRARLRSPGYEAQPSDAALQLSLSGIPDTALLGRCNMPHEQRSGHASKPCGMRSICLAWLQHMRSLPVRWHWCLRQAC